MSFLDIGVIWSEQIKSRPSWWEGEFLADTLPPLPAPAGSGEAPAADPALSVVLNSLCPEESEGEIILVFASNTEVLNVEDLLEERDLPFELIPVPKEVNPNCGLAIAFAEDDSDDILAALEEEGFSPQAAYLRRGDEFESLEPFY